MTRRLALVLVLALVGCGGSDQPAEVAQCLQLGVPAYVSPADLRHVGTLPAVRYVVLNPASGPDVESDPTLARAVADVQRDGPRVLGYVHTSYGTRPLALVADEIDRYRRWYGVDGVFVDEVSDSAADLPYYRRLSAVIRRRTGDVVALNPGVVPARGYFALADVVVTFEDTWDRYRRPFPKVDSGRAEQWHLVLDAGADEMRRAVQLANRRGATVVDVTDAGEDETWNRLPSYLDEQAGVLNGLRRCGR